MVLWVCMKNGGPYSIHGIFDGDNWVPSDRWSHFGYNSQSNSALCTRPVPAISQDISIMYITYLDGSPSSVCTLRGSCGKSKLQGSFSGVLAWRSCRCHVLEVPLWKLLGPEVLVSRSCKIRSPPAAAGPFDKSCELIFCSDMKMLVKLLYKSLSLWEALVEILVKFCQRPLHDLVQVLVRSSWIGPDEIL